jgi:hypothetical protein
MDWKDSNPKTFAATDRLPMSLFPDTALAYGNLAFLEGALKYGRYNWRVAGVRVSTYIDAARRHLMKYYSGEYADPKTNVPHLASVLACIAIIIDADEHGKLDDDRPPADTSLSVEDNMLEQMQDTVRNLKRLFEHHNPRQYTIKDELPESPSNSPDAVDSAATYSSGHREYSAAQA